MKIKTLITLIVSIVVMVVFMPFITTYDETTEIEGFTAGANDNNIYTGSRDGTVKKLDSDGGLVWSSAIPNDFVTALAVDSDSQVVFGRDSYISKLNTLGDGILWTNSDSTTDVYDVVIDNNNNVIQLHSTNIITKVNNLGVTSWTDSTTLGGLQMVVTSGSNNNIYVGGYDGVVTALDTDGNLLWTRPTDGSVIRDITFKNGFIYAINLDDIIKINESGEITSTITVVSTLKAVEVDNDGNIYVGVSSGYIYKYDSEGVMLWNNPIHTLDVNSLAVDNNGDVYSGSSDETVKKISPSGVVLWTYSGHTGYVNDVIINKFSSSEFTLTQTVDPSTVKSVTINDVVIDSANWTIDGDTLSFDGVSTDLGDSVEITYIVEGLSGTAIDTMVNLIPLILVSGVVLMTVVYAKRKEA